MAMLQLAFEPGNAALAQLQESFELLQEWLERFENQRLVLELAIQLAAAPEALARVKLRLRVRDSPRQTVETGELRHTEAARKSRTRQTQRLADGVHARLRKTFQHFLRPTQSSKGDGRDLPDEMRAIHHGFCLICARTDERLQRCGRKGQYRLHADRAMQLRNGQTQTAHSPKQIQAPLHFQQQAIRRRKAHARREPLRASSQPLENFLTARLQRELWEMRCQPQFLRSAD